MIALAQQIIVYWLILLGVINFSWGQQEKIFFENAEPINEFRYQNIKGTPYLFETWVVGSVMQLNGQMVDEVPLNYNGYEREFEIRKEDSFIKLNSKELMMVRIDLEKNKGSINSDYLFFRNVDSEVNEEIVQAIYEGDQLKLLGTFRAEKSTKVVQEPGKTRKFERFIPIWDYYLKQGNELTLIKFRKKSILKALGQKSKMEEYIEKENLKLNDITEIIQLLRYYETLNVEQK